MINVDVTWKAMSIKASSFLTGALYILGSQPRHIVIKC